jgi:hypothetical protein
MTPGGIEQLQQIPHWDRGGGQLLQVAFRCEQVGVVCLRLDDAVTGHKQDYRVIGSSVGNEKIGQRVFNGRHSRLFVGIGPQLKVILQISSARMSQVVAEGERIEMGKLELIISR